MGVRQENALVLLISKTGKTREINELGHLARNLRPDIKFIVISGNAESELAKAADVFLFTGAPKEVCLLGLTPTTSTTIMTVIGDVLVVNTMQAIHFDSQQYALWHHGGYLGEKSREQSKEQAK